MNTLQLFFSSNPSGVPFQLFDKTHISILTFCIISSYIVLKKIKKNRLFELIVGTTLIVQQVCLYTWYTSTQYNLLSEGLPLYHCRIAILTLGIGLVFKIHSLFKFGAVWGIVGSFFALLLPSPDPFQFPHLTNISFLLGHILLLWGSIYTLWIKGDNICKKDLKLILLVTNIYCIAMAILNPLLGSNYGYMSESPIHLPIYLSQISYTLLATVSMNLLILIMYHIYKRTNIEEDETLIVLTSDTKLTA